MINKLHSCTNLKIPLVALLLICFTLWGNSISAQTKKTRILFVLDASGSMAGKWQGKTKFDIASELLVQSIDSIQQAEKNVEFGLRVFGHQYSREANNCEDSKLEVTFSNKNAGVIKNKLSSINYQGQTPIAYSLFQAATDFPDEKGVKNVIVLITDGIETCDGDPCAIALELRNHNISLKPFIIGLGMGETGKQYFDCVGTYYDAQDARSFSTAIDVVISQALNTTTAQVNLLDAFGKPTETNVEMVFYDSHSGKVSYSFVHALNMHSFPDTIYLNPVGKYDLIVSTVPEISKKNIELTPGRHNIIAVNAPQGQLVLKQEGVYGFSDVQALIRPSGKMNILDVQALNTRKKLIVGNYDLEILTLPVTIIKGVKIEQSKDTEIKVDPAGNAAIEVHRSGIASIYVEKDGKPELIYEFQEISGKTIIALQPGDYSIVYRPKFYMNAELTQVKTFKIYSRGTTNIKF